MIFKNSKNTKETKGRNFSLYSWKFIVQTNLGYTIPTQVKKTNYQYQWLTDSIIQSLNYVKKQNRIQIFAEDIVGTTIKNMFL